MGEPSAEESAIELRKREHLAPFRDGSVAAAVTQSWLDRILLIHQALPELDLAEIRLESDFVGRTFKAPLMITGMTGGTREARQINRDLAWAAEKMGVGFGLGSQRAMIAQTDLGASYRVRDVAPHVFLAGNIGGTQLAATPLDRLRRALDEVGADALCVHLNAAQELAQPEGDRDWRGVAQAISRVVREIDLPVIVKEVGCGLSREVGARLVELGVGHADIAGAGGTDFVALELDRRGTKQAPELDPFRGWGIPTAAALMELAHLDLTLIASGGVRSGLDVARAIAAGATLAGIAAPVLEAWFRGGRDEVVATLERICDGLRAAMMLTGSRSVDDLRGAPRVITGSLRDWCRERGVMR